MVMNLLFWTNIPDVNDRIFLHASGITRDRTPLRSIETGVAYDFRKTSARLRFRTTILISIYTHIHQHMSQVTSVRMRTDTKALLDDLKLNPRETYDDVVRRLAEAAYDDEPLTREEIEAMEEGIADLKAGRSRSLDEIMKELGDDKVIEKRKTKTRNL